MIPMLMAMFSQLIINFYSGFEANFQSRVMQLSDYEEPVSVFPNNVDNDLKGVFEKYRDLVSAESAVKQFTNISDGLLKVSEDNLLD